MNKAPAFQLYAQDFLTGVMYLTNEEVGIYIRMLCKQWTDGSIPKKRLGFLVGYDWENLSDELKSKFKESDGRLINTKLEEVREQKKKFLEKQKNNGKKGGRPRKDTKSKNPNKSQKKPLEVEIEDEVEIENKKEVILEKSEKPFAEIWPTFDDFWEEYDKKVGSKEKIEKKWSKISQSVKEEIMQYLPNYKIAQPEKKYRKNPETFLNNNGWEDELIISNEKLNKDFKRLKTREQNSQGWGN